ncbi:hypothetical protein XPA_009139 [Xanthoria parietina]
MNFPILDIAQKTIPPTSNTKSTPISTKKITTPPHTQKKNSIAIIENELGLPMSWVCHACSTTNAETTTTCTSCKHGRCENCPQNSRQAMSGSAKAEEVLGLGKGGGST